MRKLKKYLLLVPAGIASVVASASPAFADADLNSLFAAVALSDISTKVVAVLISMLTILLLFVGYRFAKKSMGQGK